MEDLKSAIAKLNPLVFFDVVGGGSPIVVPTFEALPYKGSLIFVANLTHEPVPIDSAHLMFNQKSITSFFMFAWIGEISEEERQNAFKQVADDLGKNGGAIYGSNFTRELPLS